MPLLPSRFPPKSPWLAALRASLSGRYLAALVCALCGHLVWRVADGGVGGDAPFQVLLPFVAASAWLGGFGPGMLTAVTSAFFAFLVPLSFPERLELLLFLVVGTLVSALCGSLNQARGEAESVAEELEISQRRYRQIVETAAEGIWMVDTNFRTTFVNARMAAILGEQPAAMLGRPLADWIFAADIGQMPLWTETSAPDAGGGSGEIEHRYRRSDGVEIWCRAVCTALRSEDGEFSGLMALHIDITARRKVAEALRESNARFELAARATAGYLYEWNSDSGKVWRSDSFETVMGYRREECEPSAAWWQSLIHPLDVPILQAIIRNPHESTLRSGSAYSVEYRARRADGVYRWLWDRAAVEVGDDGETTRILGSVLDITDRKNAENALRESETRFRRLSEVISHIVIITDAQGKPEFYSPQWYHYTGIATSNIDPEMWKAHIHPDDFKATFAAWLISLQTGVPYQHETRLRGADGDYRWFMGRMAPLRDENDRISHWMGTCTDIHNRKRQERAQSFLARLGPILSSSLEVDTLLARVAQSLVPDFADRCAIFLRGASGVEARALHTLQAFPFKQTEIDREAQRLETLFNASGDFSRRLEERAVVVALHSQNAVIGAIRVERVRGDARYHGDEVALFEDLARRVAVVLENVRLYEQLQLADRRKDDFLAMLAHELRNPMAAIAGARSLLDELLEGEAAQLTAMPRAILGRQLAQLTRLLDDLLDVSRITRGKIELRHERLDLVEVVKTAVEAARPLIAARQHALEIRLLTEPLWMQGDAARLGQITLNLLVNAAKYTDLRGHIVITLEIVAPVTPGAAWARLSVRDNGAGLSPEMLESVWNLFVQSPRTLDRAQGGLGLGLTLVKSLVEMHGGRVGALSEGLGRGSEFWAMLPVEAQNAPALPASTAPQRFAAALPAPETPVQPSPVQHATGRKILVVDDNRDAAQMLSTWLRVRHFEVDTAFDGEAGLARALSWRPAVALLDIGMPGLDGYELAARLRAHFGNQIQLIAITGYGQNDDRARALAAGFNAHLTKPIAFKRLEELLAEIP